GRLRLRLRSGRGRGLRCGLWRRLGRWGGRRLGLRLRLDRARADDRLGEAAKIIDGREAALGLAVPRRNRPRGPAGAAHVVVAPAVYVRLAGHPRARRLAQRVGDLGLDHGGRRRLRGGCGRWLGRGRGWALLRRARLSLRSGRWRRRGLLRRGARLLRRLLRGLRGLLRGFGRRGRRGGGLGRGLCLRLRRDLRLCLRRLDLRLARRCGLPRRRAEHDIGNTADGGAERACGEQALAELLERGRVPRGEVLHRVRPRLLRRLRRALGERAGDEPAGRALAHAPDERVLEHRPDAGHARQDEVRARDPPEQQRTGGGERRGLGGEALRVLRLHTLLGEGLPRLDIGVPALENDG